MSDPMTWAEVNRARAAQIDEVDAAKPAAQRTSVVEVQMPDGLHRYDVGPDETPGAVFLRAMSELAPWQDSTVYWSQPLAGGSLKALATQEVQADWTELPSSEVIDLSAAASPYPTGEQ